MEKSRLEEGAEQQVLARQDRDDINELPRCRNPWKINSSGDTESKGDFRLKQLLLLCAFLGLSVIPMILGRVWIQDELSFVFKCKTMGRVTRIEQQEKVSISRRRYRTRRYIKEIEHYVYTVDGRRYNGTSTLRWTKKKSEGNTRVPIYYDGDKPSESRLLTVWWVWTKVCIAGLLMWLFFFACMTTVHDIVEGREIKTEDGTLVKRFSIVALVFVVIALLI